MGNKVETAADRKYSQGQYLEAISSYQKLLQSLESGNNVHKRSEVLNRLGDCYSEIGMYDDALINYENALEIQLSNLGNDHIDLATTYNGIGLVHYKQQNFQEARINLEKSLEIQTKKLPPTHKSLAANYYNIGQVLRELNENSRALELYKKALQINLSHRGKCDPQVAVNHHGLGLLYLQLKDFRNAETHLKQAFEIRQKCFGAMSIEAAKSLSSLGCLASSMGNCEISIDLHCKTLAIRENLLGNDAPDTASTRRYLARELFEANKYVDSYSMNQKALDFYLKEPGQFTYQIVQICNLMGDCMSNLKKPKEAETFYALAKGYLGENNHLERMKSIVIGTPVSIRSPKKGRSVVFS